ncbi:MAG TPA: DsbA family protein [Gemmatimonadaceae bacterium]|nr:DsbA family protein [Gemmatimonadaceae bacterium]
MNRHGLVSRAATLVIACSVFACKGDSRTQPSAQSAAGTAGASASGDAATTSTPARDDSILARADRGRIQGNENAPVWVIEVSDFECPYCGVWHDSVYAQLRREFIESGKVRFAYINYPIPSHRHAWPAAITAMCAAEQDRFWPVHDAIFHSRAAWTPLTDSRAYFDSLAVANGANAGRLRACVESDAPRPLIQADMERAIAAGVNATPTFLIGDNRLSGVQPIDRLRAAIEQEIAKKRQGG